MPHLAFQLTDGNEFIFEILEDRLTIGRSTTNGVVLDKDFISNFHAELLKQPGGSYDLVDLKSSNGTFVNGQRIERCRLKSGDRITFGPLESLFRERLPKGIVGRHSDADGVTVRGKSHSMQSHPDSEKIERTKPVILQVSPLEASKRHESLQKLISADEAHFKNTQGDQKTARLPSASARTRASV